MLRRADDDVSLLDRRSRGRQIVSLRVAAAAALALALIACNNKPSAPAASQTSQVFQQRCIICHQPNAQGVSGLYPPLADSIGNYVRVKDGRQYLVHVLLTGLSGPVPVKGVTYNGLMPQFAYLSDDDIAAALNEVLMRFNSAELPKDFQPITPAEVKAGRASAEKSTQLMRERAQILGELQDAASGASK